MNGSSLTSSAGMAENGPSLGHRVSAHATPQEMTATVHQYPIGIRKHSAPLTHQLLAERDRLGPAG